MKIRYALLAAIILLAGCDNASQNADAAKPAELTTQEQKLSYVMGQNIGGQFKAEEIPLDVSAFKQGLEDALAAAGSKLTDDDVATVLETFQKEQMAKRMATQQAASEKNGAEGKAFLAEKAAEEGVIVLDSGLQYKVIEPGTGPSPTDESVVEVHYRGTLVDGTEFDSSYKRGVPAQFGVTQVIPGWTEALKLMKEGGKWELYIPPELAYGPSGSGNAIGPNQTLIFEVELLKAGVEEGAEG